MGIRAAFSLLFVAVLQNVLALQLGVGIYDMTGPVTEINFMGYAVPGQRGSGIHQRLRARAFAFADGEKRNMYVSIDGGMGSDLVNMKVLDRLNERLGKDVYTIVSYKKQEENCSKKSQPQNAGNGHACFPSSIFIFFSVQLF